MYGELGYDHGARTLPSGQQHRRQHRDVMGWASGKLHARCRIIVTQPRRMSPRPEDPRLADRHIALEGRS